MKLIYKIAALACGIFTASHGYAGHGVVDYVERCKNHFGYSTQGAKRNRRELNTRVYYDGRNSSRAHSAVRLFPHSGPNEIADIVAVKVNQQNVNYERGAPLSQVYTRLDIYDRQQRKYVMPGHGSFNFVHGRIYQEALPLWTTSRTGLPQFVYCFKLTDIPRKYRNLSKINFSTLVYGQPKARIGVLEATAYTQGSVHHQPPRRPRHHPRPTPRAKSVSCDKGYRCSANPPIGKITNIQLRNCTHRRSQIQVNVGNDIQVSIGDDIRVNFEDVDVRINRNGPYGYRRGSISIGRSGRYVFNGSNCDATISYIPRRR